MYLTRSYEDKGGKGPGLRVSPVPDNSGISMPCEPTTHDVSEGAGRRGAKWGESVVVSSDIPLGFPVARSFILDEGSVNPSGLVELSEAALDNEESW